MLIGTQQHGGGTDFVAATEDRNDPCLQVDRHQQRAFGHAFVVPVPLAIADRTVDRQHPAHGVEAFRIGDRLGCNRAMRGKRLGDRLRRSPFGRHDLALRGRAAADGDAGEHQRSRDCAPADPFQNDIHAHLMRIKR